jgi:hypothetical protein
MRTSFTTNERKKEYVLAVMYRLGEAHTLDIAVDYIHPWEVLKNLDRHHPLNIYAKIGKEKE